MKNALQKISYELKQNADEKTKKSGQRFFKEKIELYGVKSAVVRKIAKEYYKIISDKSKNEIFELCEELWKSGRLEETFIACNWSDSLHKDYKPEDIKIFSNWIDNYVNNWASCDTLCNHTVGAFIEKYPAHLPILKKWAKSDNRWMRRAAAVSLIIPAKRGLFLKDIFEIADILLFDKDDMVQKGYGWLLKEASRNHLQEVFEYVVKNKQNMPRTALRYAIEKMPKELKIKAMEK